MQVAASAYSQSNVSIEARNTSVKEIFAEIQEKSGYRFFYSDDLIDLNQRITVTSNNQPVESIMADISKKTELSYKILEDNLIVVSPPITEQERTITGRVSGMLDGEAIPGVNVVLKDSGSGTITDIDGNYSIDLGTL
jgi:hypothetical protein